MFREHVAAKISQQSGTGFDLDSAKPEKTVTILTPSLKTEFFVCVQETGFFRLAVFI